MSLTGRENECERERVTGRKEECGGEEPEVTVARIKNIIMLKPRQHYTQQWEHRPVASLSKQVFGPIYY